MKLEKDARIYTVDGQEIGSLSRFVIDPRTKNVTNIVFKRGILSQEEHVLPMRLIDHVDEAGIHLQALPVGRPEDLPGFQENEYIVADENTLLNESSPRTSAIDSYYYYPPVGLNAGSAVYPNDIYFNGPMGAGPANQMPGVPTTGANNEPPIAHTTEENIPEGTVSLKEGSKVYSSDGKHIGNVERVFVNSDSGQATHLVISKGLLLKERKQIPVNWVDNILENEVYLAVNAPFTDRLPDYTE